MSPPLTHPSSGSSGAAAPAGNAAATAAVWADALTALQLLAQNPQRLGGLWLRAPHGPVREAWLQALAQQPLPVLRAPGSVDPQRWLGGLDLAATLQHGRVHEQAGLLRQADGGLLCLPMAERFAPALTSTLAQTLDRGGVDTGGAFQPSRFGVVALDESLDDEAPLAPVLQERLGLWIDLREVPPSQALQAVQATQPPVPVGTPQPVVAGESALQALCGTALALGIDSLRVPQLALAVACAHAALQGRDHVADEDLAYACRTVLAPRARQWPADASAAPEAQDPTEAEHPPAPNDTAPAEPPDPSEASAAPEQAPPPADTEATPPPAAMPEPEALQAMMVAAAAARLPPDLLQRLMTGAAPTRGHSQGSSGQTRQGGQRGRPLPPRPGRPGGGARLHVLATLRAAAPRQRLRGRTDTRQPLRIRAEDFHLHRHQQHQASCLILALDASGSAALHRLAEAKGAVQLLLEQSYARRDSVCVIGFRGAQAQLLLPMTRSLVRARRALTGLPGGGGTPLASALQLAHEQAALLQRQGVTPILVVLSDGRANVTLQGLGGRVQAQAEAQHWARVWHGSGHAGLWIDTAPQPEVLAQQLAQTLGARYLPMPQLQSQRLAQALLDARPAH
jgi:magnesium chelatase subunit D